MFLPQIQNTAPSCLMWSMLTPFQDRASTTSTPCYLPGNICGLGSICCGDCLGWERQHALLSWWHQNQLRLRHRTFVWSFMNIIISSFWWLLPWCFHSTKMKSQKQFEHVSIAVWLLYDFSTLSQRIPLQALKNLPDRGVFYKSVRPAFSPFKKEHKKQRRKQTNNHKKTKQKTAVFRKVLDSFHFGFSSRMMIRTWKWEFLQRVISVISSI